MNLDNGWSYSDRLLSLDVFRGITIVLMILVNSQSFFSAFPVLKHVPWHGCSLADMVFPFFLFIVGITIVFSFNKYQSDNKLVRKSILLRSLFLFALGLFLNIFPFPITFSSLRLFGTLQRIAICYLVVSLIYLKTSIRQQVMLFWVLLLGYWLVMMYVSVPGGDAGDLSFGGLNWASYGDQRLLSRGHLYAKSYDPEGLFSTLNAIATTLSGLIFGHFLIRSQRTVTMFSSMVMVGIVLVLLGWFWSYFFPLNKTLWTSSFVLWTSGFALLVYGFCYLMVDLLGYGRCFFIFKVCGMNALFAFMVHVVLLRLMGSLALAENASILAWLCSYFDGFKQPAVASLMFSVVFFGVNFLLLMYLYQRRIFIRL